VLRNADAIVFCRAADEPVASLDVVRAEVAAAGIEKPAMLALTKADEVEDAVLADGSGLETVAVSILDDESLDRLREAIWRLTGLIRVYPRRDGRADDEPFALSVGATVADVADRVHHDVGRACTGALIWGPSARFDGQRVGRDHVVADGDVVEVLRR
jgi:ribosome-interacting GTPase 1